MKKWLRWLGLITFGVVSCIILIFWIFLVDTIVKRYIEKVGTQGRQPEACPEMVDSRNGHVGQGFSPASFDFRPVIGPSVLRPLTTDYGQLTFYPQCAPCLCVR